MADTTGLADIVKRTAQANAKFYKGWMDLSLEYMRGISGIFGGAVGSTMPTQEMDAGTGALVLESEAGAAASGTFLVSNDLERAVSCKFVASDFKDPQGKSTYARTTFDPAGLELAPGEQRVVQVSILMDDTLTPGVGYAGEISISGMEGFAVPVVLRRQHTVDDGSVSPQSSDAEAPDATTTPIVSPSAPRKAKGAKRKKG
ncbi:MAG: hypothetical protein ABI625_08355 [bacterium]